MQEFLNFALQHWILSSLFIALVIIIIIYESYAKASGIPQVSPQLAVSMINREDAVVLDIRDVTIFKKGHIIGAIRINGKDLEKDLKKLNKYQQHPVIVVCDQGQQSAATAKLLLNHSFEKVKVLAGGVKAWQEAGLPLEKEGKSS